MKTIFVLNHWWVLVGSPIEHKDDTITLDNAAVIRRWGTTKGLGQLASDGPTSDTVLDPQGVTVINRSAVLFRLACNPDKWP